MQYFKALIFCGLLFSCGSPSFPPAENPLDAAREFVDGNLKGDFKKSLAYVVQNDKNISQVQALKQKYYAYTDQQRQDYRNANMVILKEQKINDRETMIHYENSFDHKADSLKVIEELGAWLVDLQ